MAPQQRSDRRLIQQTCSWIDGRTAIEQTVNIGRRRFASRLVPRGRTSRNADVAWLQSALRGCPISWPASRRRLRAADLFCAAGGMTLGLRDAGRSIGVEVEPAFAADSDGDALCIYNANHGPAMAAATDVQSLVSYKVSGRGSESHWGTRPAIIDPNMRGFLQGLDIVIAGPPCQGHSNFNNRTRRDDSRNLLYVTTVAFAIAVDASLCIIENVPDVQLDKFEVVDTARVLFAKSGYTVSDAVVAANDHGVGQRRRRHFMVAAKGRSEAIQLVSALGGLSVPSLTLRNAIGDLADRKGRSIMDTVGNLSPDNETRINWLFRHEKYDLPAQQRPDCHRNGHTYPSVYGRMKWDEPAQTITTGFLCPGQGRYVHPSRRRTVTPREAARIQGFPDTYDFCPAGLRASRSLLRKVIGDAVPPPLARAVCLAAIAAILD